MINIIKIGILVSLWGLGWSVYLDLTGALINATNIVIAFGPIIMWFLWLTWFMFFVWDD